VCVGETETQMGISVKGAKEANHRGWELSAYVQARDYMYMLGYVTATECT